MFKLNFWFIAPNIYKNHHGEFNQHAKTYNKSYLLWRDVSTLNLEKLRFEKYS